MTDLRLRNVEVDGEVVNVTVSRRVISTISSPATEGARDRGDEAAVIDGHGGALLPGLWDHHIHLLALAAARRSVDLGGVAGRVDLRPLRDATELAAPGQWIRAVGYYPTDGHDLDRYGLDLIAPDHPVRVQHSSGAMWILNSVALSDLDLDTAPDGVELDDEGRPTGRLYGADDWLTPQLHATDPPDLTDVGTELARYGVVGVTDATPFNSTDGLAALARAAEDIPQHVVATGGPVLADHPFPTRVRRGPVKLLLADHSLPTLDDVTVWIDRAHRAKRPVMIHCVTRASLVLALSAWDQAGSFTGDRIEHGSVIPPELDRSIARHRLTVVTQPNFIAERGDRYLDEVDAEDIAHLYPCRRLLDQGIRVGGSTDAPFGHPDPWTAIAAATQRISPSGRRVGDDRPLTVERALELFLTAPDDPGGRPRLIEPGRPADLCLLDRPVADVRATVAAGAADPAMVAATIISGDPVHVRR